MTELSSLISSEAGAGSLFSSTLMPSGLWVWPRRYQVADNRRRSAAMKLRQPRLQILVSRCDTLVLALMLEPRGDQKRLDHVAGLGRVLVNIPVVGPVAQPLRFERVQRGKKRLTIVGRDFVVDDDLHGAAIGLHVVGHDGRGPMHRRREIDRGAGLQLPACKQRDYGQCAGCGEEMC